MNTNGKKVLYHGMGLLAAFCLMLIVLISAVEAVVYSGDAFFEREYRKYNVTARVDMEMDELLRVTEEMMAYLRGDRADLVVETVVAGENRAFFNEKEIRHMVDVQGLFLGAMRLRLAAGAAAALLAAWLLKKKQGLCLLRMVQWGVGLFLGGMAALALLASTNFTKYFTWFHLIFFDNNDWILNPQTDLLINIVPEGFFRDTALAIVLLFLGVSALLWLAAALLRRRFFGGSPKRGKELRNGML